MRLWLGILGFEGQATGDGRFIVANALHWDVGDVEPLMWAPEDVGGHTGARIVGSITEIWRESDGAIWGRGELDTGSEDGQELVRRLTLNPAAGRVSFDLDDFEGEVEELDDGEVIYKMTSARVRGATIVNISAFKDARIWIDVQREGELPEDSALIASAIPVAPPASWFAQPEVDAPTPLTITEDGRVFGHLAAWGTCHVGWEDCKEPPSSPTDYAYFRTGSVLASAGETIPTGRIVMSTGHASLRASAADATAHYDKSGAAVADVAAGEDAYGIWVAGALRPGVTSEQIRELRASPLSGDWRSIRGHLELVAALAVSVPGFPTPHGTQRLANETRTSFRSEGGFVQALRSAGMLGRAKPIAPRSQVDVVALSRSVEASALAVSVRRRP